jgi:MFS transporter, CP family, cyanate transporter
MAVAPVAADRDFPQMIGQADHIEPAPRRVRAMLGGEWIFDSTRARYVWEWPYYPQYYIPVEDINMRFLLDELQSLIYYSTLSWFPTMFRDHGVSAAHAGDLLALMNLGNAVTALLVPVFAHRAADQRRLAVLAMLATGAGLGGAVFGPTAGAIPFVLLLGLGQGATLGLGIFYTMARAPDPVTAASLSAFSQGLGYLMASTGPLIIGLLHDVTGSWTVPGLALLAACVATVIVGWLAGRARTVPATVAPGG